MSDAIEQSDELCGELGLAYNKLVTVEQVWEAPPEPEAPAPSEGEEEEEEEEPALEEEEAEKGPEPTVYRITVVCGEERKLPKKEENL